VPLTGDNEAAVHAVAAEVGIHVVIAEVLPADKVDVVKSCRTRARPSRWSATA
jgi:P-type Cu+ transporter